MGELGRVALKHLKGPTGLSILHITYALQDHDATEPPVAEVIKAMGPSLHCTPCAWLVDSVYSAPKA